MTDQGGLVPYGWDDRVAARLAALVQPGTLPARVVRVERDGCTVTTGAGEADRRARAGAPPAVGDWVVVDESPTERRVVAVADRWSELVRRDPEGRLQILAGNVDLVFVAAPADRLSPARVERETALAWDSGARPVVLLTKSDLAPRGLEEELRTRIVGVDVVATSTATGEGVTDVKASLRPARTAVLLGPSGAGKSSLANVLLGHNALATAAVRDQDHRGRHTTGARQLLLVPSGGVLIDTPGLRSLSLAVDHGGVAATFPEIETLARQCRFTDCRHGREPDCAVLAAVDAGTLDPERLVSFRKLSRELAYQARRDDRLAAKEATRVWKTRTKAVRRLYRKGLSPGRAATDMSRSTPFGCGRTRTELRRSPGAS